MSTFSTLTTAQVAKLNSVAKLSGIAIVVEDTSDLTTEMAIQIMETGLVVLIGIPAFKNESEFSNNVTADIDQQILVRECPPIWRDAPGVLHCQDIAQMVAQSLQGLNVVGFQKLRVVNGTPLGNVRPDAKKEISFQDYRLELKTRLSLQPI
jgi:hypothetical protein